MKKNESGMNQVQFWLLMWMLGLAGQFCWNIENQWFNTFVYAKIAKDSSIVTLMVITSALVTTFSTFLFGTLSDRLGTRRRFVSFGYIVWGLCTILFGFTEFIGKGAVGVGARVSMWAAVMVILADDVMSFFGSMGNDSGYNAWSNDMTDDKNRGQIGAVLAVQPIIGTIVGTVLGGFLIGSENNYQRLFWSMGLFVNAVGIFSLFFLKDSPSLKPHREGSLAAQFCSVFKIKGFFAQTELVLACVTTACFFIPFNIYFVHMGNWMIYRMGFSADSMGLIQGLSLLAASLSAIPAARLINKNRTPRVAVFAVAVNIIGLWVLTLFIRPDTVNTQSVFSAQNAPLFFAVFAAGMGLVLITQSMTMWVKQLYPEQSRGQFEGIRILFFVLTPMIIGTIIGNIIIKNGAGSIVNEYGITENIPVESIYMWAAILVTGAFIPLFFAAKHYYKRVNNKDIHPLLTVWGENLNKECPLNDYPRPQLERKQWQCLNGAWQYAISDGKEIPQNWDGEILVPFSPECVLSGVQRKLMPGQTLWYRRTVRFGKMPVRGERLLLHFGAADQHCTVYVGGKIAGSHSGGYWPFYFDITGLINEGENEIIASVTDDTNLGDEAYGKQTLNRGKIWYTGQSGLWQTVWCETVPENHVKNVRINPDLKKGEVEFTVIFDGTHAQDGKVTVFDGDVVVAEAPLTNNGARIRLPENFKSWSPDSPFLYGAQISAGKDSVRTYFGMREFGIIKGKSGPVLSLNGKPIFHHGLLDQGYWSDGMYTAPSDEAMIWDIERIKTLGFNMLRKHIKIEPLRWYYHCDRLGVLVWQDFVSGGGPYKPFVVQYAPWIGLKYSDGPKRYKLMGRKSPEGRKNFLRDAERTVNHLYNCVSLAVWVPFNEGWGQFDAADMAAKVRSWDSSRAIDHASGYFDRKAGDFHSYHIYFKPFSPKSDSEKRVLALTEFGGYSLPSEGHTVSPVLYGYKMFSDKKTLNENILKLYKNDVLRNMSKGLSAAVYTQVSDVEDEINGLFTYDRKEIKADASVMKQIADMLNKAFGEHSVRAD